MGAAAMLVAVTTCMSAQETAHHFIPFDNFVSNTRSAEAGTMLALPGNKAASTANVEEMRQHILGLYDGVKVSHSFLLDGDHFDCVPTEQQPSIRGLGLKSIASAPKDELKKPEGAGKSAPKANAITSQLAADQKFDEFGNSRVCEANTIPMRRVTLEEVSRFKTLKNYLEKGPNGTGQAPLPQDHASLKQSSVTPESGASIGKASWVPPSPVAHKYSFTYQYVNNLGQTDTLSLWDPYVYTSYGEIFSLAQSWTIGYSPVTQTAEVGWQNYPALYGGQNSRLFIYWTADGYQHTGCYNLSCAGFVQTNGSWYLGAGFSNYSTRGGAQYEFRAQYYFYQGNWWLGLGNANSITWIGYYPGTIYGSGPMRTHSQLLEFGSESVGSNPWPAEGSGDFASAGWDYAGYQRELYHWANPSDAAYWDTLTADQPSPNCYSIAGPYFGGYNPPSNDWGIYFYYGGPGGYNCQ